jgi:hypothetical protein
MRCGTYIKNVIEPNIIENKEREIGWENWLSEKPKGEQDRDR